MCVVAPVGAAAKLLLPVMLCQYLRDGTLAVSPRPPRFLAVVRQPPRHACVYNSTDAAMVKADAECGCRGYNVAVGSVQPTLDRRCLFLIYLLSRYISIPNPLCIELGLLDCGLVNNASGICVEALASFPNPPGYVAYPIVKHL